MFNLGTPELVVILAIALLLFGPKNLPKLGSTIGKTAKNFRDSMESKPKEEQNDSDEIIVELDTKPLGNTSQKYCDQCGEPASESSRFCTQCGSELKNN